MLQYPLPTAPATGNDFDLLPEDRDGEVAMADSVLDETEWLMLLAKIDQEEGGP